MMVNSPRDEPPYYEPPYDDSFVMNYTEMKRPHTIILMLLQKLNKIRSTPG